MGYYTNFTLSVHKHNCSSFDFEKIVEELNEAIGYEIFSDTGDCIEYQKWYECLEDMCDFSKRYPDLIFEIEGVGEEQGDVWEAYFCNGKYKKYVVKTVIPSENWFQELMEM